MYHSAKLMAVSSKIIIKDRNSTKTISGHKCMIIIGDLKIIIGDLKIIIGDLKCMGWQWWCLFNSRGMKEKVLKYSIKIIMCKSLIENNNNSTK